MRERAIEAAKSRNENDVQVAMEEEPAMAPDRHAGGEIPPVRAGLEKTQASPSELAFEDSDTKRDYRSKIALLIVNNFSGDTKKAFEHYDRDKDGGVNQSELVHMLADAGVGNGTSRNKLAIDLFGDRLEKDFDATIEWDEFQRTFAG